MIKETHDLYRQAEAEKQANQARVMLSDILGIELQLTNLK